MVDDACVVSLWCFIQPRCRSRPDLCLYFSCATFMPQGDATSRPPYKNDYDGDQQEHKPFLSQVDSNLLFASYLLVPSTAVAVSSPAYSGGVENFRKIRIGPDKLTFRLCRVL